MWEATNWNAFRMSWVRLDGSIDVFCAKWQNRLGKWLKKVYETVGVINMAKK